MGLSEVPQQYAMAEYADDVAALLDALQAPRAVICGLSMGGYVAFELLRRHRDRVRALVLVNTRAEPDDTAGKHARDTMVELVEREGPAALADVMVPQLLAPANLSAMPQVAQRLRTMIVGQPAAGIVGALRAMRDRPDSRPLLPEIDVPTLVIAGTFDAKTSPMWATYVAKTLSNSTTIIIPGIGHLVTAQSTCAQTVFNSFLEKPTSPDTSCVKGLKPPPFN